MPSGSKTNLSVMDAAHASDVVDIEGRKCSLGSGSNPLLLVAVVQREGGMEPSPLKCNCLKELGNREDCDPSFPAGRPSRTDVSYSVLRRKVPGQQL